MHRRVHPAIFGLPYDFTENMVDAASARACSSQRVALRVDGRAMYTPNTKLPAGRGRQGRLGRSSYFFVPRQQGTATTNCTVVLGAQGRPSCTKPIFSRITTTP